jgi:hypothetical protein
MFRHQETAPGRETPEVTSARPVVVVQLIATVALAVSTLVAVTAVSIGFARADVIGAHLGAGNAPLAIALFIGLLIAGFGALATMTANERQY